MHYSVTKMLQGCSETPQFQMLGLKNSGGGAATTCFEDTIVSPAKMATACDTMAITVKVINLFIRKYVSEGNR